MCSHGTVPARNLAYAGDLCRISSGEERHTTHLIFLSTISVRNSSKGSYRPGILCRKRSPSKFSGSSTRRIIGGFHAFLLSYLDQNIASSIHSRGQVRDFGPSLVIAPRFSLSEPHCYLPRSRPAKVLLAMLPAFSVSPSLAPPIPFAIEA